MTVSVPPAQTETLVSPRVSCAGECVRALLAGEKLLKCSKPTATGFALSKRAIMAAVTLDQPSCNESREEQIAPLKHVPCALQRMLSRPFALLFRPAATAVPLVKAGAKGILVNQAHPDALRMEQHPQSQRGPQFIEGQHCSVMEMLVGHFTVRCHRRMEETKGLGRSAAGRGCRGEEDALWQGQGEVAPAHYLAPRLRRVDLKQSLVAFNSE